MTYGIWSTQTEFDQNNYVGFIYIISNTTNNRKYIGKKNFKWKNGKISNWKTYTSSCKELNQDIKCIGLHNFCFEIVNLFHDGVSLSSAESKLQEDSDVLNKRFADGTKEYYNKNIRGHLFDTTGTTKLFSKSHKEKLSEKQKGSKNSFHGKHHTQEHKSTQSKLMIEYQKHGGYSTGICQTPDSNQKRSETLKGKIPWNLGKASFKKGLPSSRKGQPKLRKVMCDGVEYKSVRESALGTNLSVNSVRHRCHSDLYPRWYYTD